MLQKPRLNSSHALIGSKELQEMVGESVNTNGWLCGSASSDLKGCGLTGLSASPPLGSSQPLGGKTRPLPALSLRGESGERGL